MKTKNSSSKFSPSASYSSIIDTNEKRKKKKNNKQKTIHCFRTLRVTVMMCKKKKTRKKKKHSTEAYTLHTVIHYTKLHKRRKREWTRWMEKRIKKNTLFVLLLLLLCIHSAIFLHFISFRLVSRGANACYRIVSKKMNNKNWNK